MSDLKQGCEHKSVAVRSADLPLCCPRHDERIWDAHPRVYLPIEKTDEKKLVCPYCGTHYHLDDC
jgi:uncharacterized Zn-finger protein